MEEQHDMESAELWSSDKFRARMDLQLDLASQRMKCLWYARNPDGVTREGWQ